MLLNSTGIIPLVYKNVSNQCISQRNRSLCCMDSKQLILPVGCTGFSQNIYHTTKLQKLKMKTQIHENPHVSSVEPIVYPTNSLPHNNQTQITTIIYDKSSVVSVDLHR